MLISDEKQSDRTSAAGIRALHAEHYPAGAVYGYARGKLPATVPGEPVASSAAVLEALPGSGAEGASMLHLGCHGRAAVPVLHSSIRLGRRATCSRSRTFSARPARGGHGSWLWPAPADSSCSRPACPT